MYQCGFCKLIISGDMREVETLALHMRELCKRVVLGIPDEMSYARLYGDVPYSVQDTKNLLLDQGLADDVLILGDRSSYENIFIKIHYDIVFYGSCFGQAFEKFAQFAIENGITVYPMLPEKHIDYGVVDAMKIALENLQRHKKIVLFGTGVYFDLYMKKYGKRYAPTYAVDNAHEKWGSKKNNIAIKNPKCLAKEKIEDVLIIVCAKNYAEILKQIRLLGDFDYRLMRYQNFIALLEEYELTREGELDYIEKAHIALTEMLKEFDRVCNKHNLRYYMICGSLIGVLRHQGFIPWDDDVDVAMTREDYNKLRKIAEEEWKGTPYSILGFGQLGNGAFLDCMPRMINEQERLPMKVYDKVLGKAMRDVADRPFIDIYVMDNAFDNDKKHMFYMNMMKGVYNLLMGHRGGVDYDEYRPVIPEKTIRLMKFLHTVGKYMPLRFLTWWYDHLSTRANREDTECYFMPSCAIRCIERKFRKEFFQEGIRKPFLDFEVTVPKDYDGLMEAMGYHGYMQFPRMSIRKPSHYFNSDIVIW